MSYVLCRNGLKDVAGGEALKCYFLMPCYFVFEFQINRPQVALHDVVRPRSSSRAHDQQEEEAIALLQLPLPPES
jgi:hypothetical protein